MVPPGPLAIVARAPARAELRLDGKPLPAAMPAPPALTATVTLAPGRHELLLISSGQEVRVQFFVRSPTRADQPAGWLEFRTHPPSASCDACHAVRNGTWSFKGEAQSESCFSCHKPEAFAGVHSHTSETLAECQMCHSAHGSTAVRHLKLKKDLACKQCHG